MTEIDQELCTGCGACIPYCPVGAIALDAESGLTSKIDADLCVECGVCLRSDVCPTGAFQSTPSAWPRVLRSAFSDPMVVHVGTGIPGRGTEEMKTNDVTGRYRRGRIGLAIEIGRPGVGTALREVEKVARVMAGLGVKFEPANPVTQIMADPATGRLQEEVLGERVLSAIIEGDVPEEFAATVLQAVLALAPTLETVFSVSVAARVAADGTTPQSKVARACGITPYPNGKTNVGLGRPYFEEDGGDGVSGQGGRMTR